MRPLELTLQGFRSFDQAQTISFDEGFGVFRLYGENGAGKSSIWDAMSWVLYGSTSRGVRGDNVVNWGHSTRCLVKLRFISNDQEHVVFRARKPNELTLDGVVVEQEKITELVGLDRDTFLQTVLMGQFGEFFFDKKPADRLALFSTIMELDYWTQVAKKASEWTKKLEAKVWKSEGKLETLVTDTIPRWETEIQRRKDRLGQFESELEEKVAKLKEAWDPEEEPRLKKLCAKLEKKHTKLGKALSLAVKEAVKAERATGGPLGSIATIREQISAAGAIRNSLGTEFEAAEALGNQCDICGQGISKKFRQERLEQWGNALEEQDVILKALQEGKAEVEQKLEEADAHSVAKEAEVDKAEALQFDCLEELNEAKEALVECENLRKRIEKEITAIQSAKNPWVTELVEGEQTLQELTAELVLVREKLEVQRQDLSDVSFWPKGFKELRLWIIEDALGEFGAEVNNALSALGLDGWSIRFEVERETKSGKVSRGFNVLIDAPGCSAEMPWEAWSGGETQRLRVAGAVGLASLIRARRGLNIPFEVWDEPTAHLTEEGVDDLIQFFHTRARQGMEIWLVDHRSTDSGLFDGQLLACKTETGTMLR